jgi:hypothetical protein
MTFAAVITRTQVAADDAAPPALVLAGSTTDRECRNVALPYAQTG